MVNAPELVNVVLLIVEVFCSISRMPWLSMSLFAVSAVSFNDPPEAIVSDPGPLKVMVPVRSSSGVVAKMALALSKTTCWVPWRLMVPAPVRLELVPRVVVVEFTLSVLPAATSMLPALVSVVVAVIVAVASISITPVLVKLKALIAWLAAPVPVWVVLIVPWLVSVPLLTVSV